jgi:hypothetical protein
MACGALGVSIISRAMEILGKEIKQDGQGVQDQQDETLF